MTKKASCLSLCTLCTTSPSNLLFSFHLAISSICTSVTKGFTVLKHLASQNDPLLFKSVLLESHEHTMCCLSKSDIMLSGGAFSRWVNFLETQRTTVSENDCPMDWVYIVWKFTRKGLCCWIPVKDSTHKDILWKWVRVWRSQKRWEMSLFAPCLLHLWLAVQRCLIPLLLLEALPFPLCVVAVVVPVWQTMDSKY